MSIYWEDRIRHLPGDEETVTGDEVALALLAWLEELLRDLVATGATGTLRRPEVITGPQASGDEGSMSDEPEQERTPTGLAWASVAHGAGRRTSGGTSSTELAPEPRPGAPPQVLQRPIERGAVLGLGAGAPWLLADAEAEEPEVRRFHEQLARSLGDGSAELSFVQLYRAVRDALDVTQSAAGSSRTAVRAAARKAAARRLVALVLRRLRASFRELDSAARRARGPGSGPAVGQEDVLAGLISSQARAAEVLERRAAQVPCAHRIVWLLARARRRILHGILDRWQRQQLDGGSWISLPSYEDRGPQLSPPGGGQSARSAPSPVSSARRWGVGKK